MMPRNYDVDECYEVWAYDEVPNLTSWLSALCMFRRKNPGMWPSLIKMNPDNRLAGWKFDEADGLFEIKYTEKMVLKNAIYMGHFHPWLDEPTKREPLPLITKREPVVDTKRAIYRSRKDLK